MITKKLGLIAAIAATLAFTTAQAHEFKLGDLEIGHPYSRAMLPVAKVGGGYMKITNNGPSDRLVSVTSERAASVEVHEMKMNGAVMEMRELTGGLSIPAKAVTDLKPGSYHLMFINVDKPFKEGEMVKATLVFENAGSVDVEFAVGPVAGQKSADPHSAHDAHAGHGQ